MPVVTIISDLGTNDYQIPAVKGVLLSSNQHLSIVDISHNIKPYHFVEAAYILGNCFRDFPKGSLHLVGVEGDFSRKKEWIVAKLENHYFFTKNTGLLSLISEQEPEWVYLINVSNKKDYKFPLKCILAKTAAKILTGTNPKQIGSAFKDLVKRKLLQPTISSSSISGTIVYNTPYDNAITNIHRRDFDAFKGFKTCHIHYNKMDYFERIFNSYHDLPEGMAGCFFSHNGFLEIGIHGGNSKGLLSLIEGKNIWIEFK